MATKTKTATKSPPSTAPPFELAVAIENAAQQYHVPAAMLVGIWIIESGGNYPNPYVNSSGYGGLFGTQNWNASTQDQANTAAQILATQLNNSNGNVAAALLAYSGGGYSSVPGFPATTVTPPNKAPSGAGGGFWNAIENGIGSGLGDAASGQNPLSNALGFAPAKGSAQQQLGSGVTKVTDTVLGSSGGAPGGLSGLANGTEKYVLYGVAFLGGGALIILGFFLIAADLGLSAYRGVTKAAPVRVAVSVRDQFRPEVPKGARRAREGLSKGKTRRVKPLVDRPSSQGKVFDETGDDIPF